MLHQVANVNVSLNAHIHILWNIWIGLVLEKPCGNSSTRGARTGQAGAGTGRGAKYSFRDKSWSRVAISPVYSIDCNISLAPRLHSCVCSL